MSQRLSNRLTKLAVQTLGALPEFLQKRIGAGKFDLPGHELCPEVSMFLRLMGNIEAATPQNKPIDAVRAQTNLDAWTFSGPEIPIHRVADREIPSDGGRISARYYQGSSKSEGVLLYFHGGAWASGGLDSCDPICRFLAKHADICVLSVDYRLAPEHVYPAAVTDAYNAYKYVLEELSGNRFIAVGGDSAGGNIAASLCEQLKGGNLPMPHYQVLLYPVMDVFNKSDSYRLFSTGYVLTEAQMDWAKALYSPAGDYQNTFISPGLASSFQGLPPAYVATAEFDVLRDEGEAYATHLARWAPTTHLRRAPGLIHGFANMIGVSRTARAEMHRVARAIKAARSTEPANE